MAELAAVATYCDAGCAEEAVLQNVAVSIERLSQLDVTIGGHGSGDDA